MSRSLEERLRALDLRAPASLAPRLLALGDHVPPPAPRIKRHALRTTIAVAAVVLSANLAAAIVAPGYRELLAQTPVARLADGALKYTGLASSGVTPLNGTARSSGHEIRILGAYADDTRTVVVVEVDGGGLFDPNNPGAPTSGPVVEAAKLVDDDGHEYHETGYIGSDSGSVPLPFEPVTGGRPGDTLRLKLVVTRLMSGLNNTISGHWEIPFDITPAEATVLPLPPPADANGNSFVFTSATLSGRLLTLRWEVSGPGIDEVRRLAYHATPAERQALPSLANAFRTALRPAPDTPVAAPLTAVTEGTQFPDALPATGEIVAVVPGPGRYTLLLPESGTVITTLTVP